MPGLPYEAAFRQYMNANSVQVKQKLPAKDLAGPDRQRASASFRGEFERGGATPVPRLRAGGILYQHRLCRVGSDGISPSLPGRSFFAIACAAMSR